VRQISSSFGIAYLTYVMLQRQDHHLIWLADEVSWSSPVAYGVLSQIQGILNQGGLDPVAGSAGAVSVLAALVQREAFISGIQDAFVVSALIVALALPLVFFLTKKRVREARQAGYKNYAGPDAGKQVASS